MLVRDLSKLYKGIGIMILCRYLSAGKQHADTPEPDFRHEKEKAKQNKTQPHPQGACSLPGTKIDLVTSVLSV